MTQNFSVQSILERLSGVKTKADGGWLSRCPAHYDKHRSLAIDVRDGKVLLYCFAGCQYRDIVKAIGIDIGNIKTSQTQKPKPVKVWQASYYAAMSLPWPVTHGWSYQHADGSHAFAVYRLESPHGKEIRPVKPVDGGYTFGLPSAPRPLYRLPEILTADIVVVCEGELAADAVVRAGWCGTTSVGGAGGAKYTDWKPLKDKQVLIWPDNDDPGVKYAEQVKRILVGAAKIIKPFGGERDDAADCPDVDGYLRAQVSIIQDTTV